MENPVDGIKKILTEIKLKVGKQISKKLDLDKCERIVEKLGTFSASCAECQQYLDELQNHFIQLQANAGIIEETKYKQHKQFINQIVSHLQKKHGLLHEGYYLSLYMSIGMALGVTFGLTIFENIALGISIGMSMGIAIGAGLDADAKKKGKTI